jgi:hypothetical protein
LIAEVLLTTLVALSAPAGAERAPALALAASPQRLVVAAGARGTVSVLNPGSSAVVVDATTATYALDLRGRPRLGGAAPRSIAVAPHRLLLPPHGHATVGVTAVRRRGARPGDHAAALLLTSRLVGRPAVRVRMRVGVVVVVRVPGRVVRRLALGRPLVVRRARARLLRFVVANRGTLDEWIARGRLVVHVVRGLRTVAAIRTGSRRILARTEAVFELRVPSRARGRARVVVTIAPVSRGDPAARWVGRIRLG